MKDQLNIFGTEKISVAESIDLTIATMKDYGSRHKHWAAAWSFGKDSSTVVTLITQLIQTGQIPKPKTFTIFAGDTRQELIPLWIAAKNIKKQLEERGVKVHIVSAPMDKRFMVYMLGRGVPPPNNGFRWCTEKMKIDPVEKAVESFMKGREGEMLMLTGVRLGESAVRDQRINVSCSKNGAECGQGWYQNAFNGMCATLAPILHWRVCNVWDWLKIFAPMPKYGGWDTAMIADAYGGDEENEESARTGCIGCPLLAGDNDSALDRVVRMPEWNYLKPLQRLKPLYLEMRKPQYRLRKPGGQLKKDGTLQKNQNRMGPLTFEARKKFLAEIIQIQNEVNEKAVSLGRPKIDILNSIEVKRIKELILIQTWPNGWEGTEPLASKPYVQMYSDGSIQNTLI